MKIIALISHSDSTTIKSSVNAGFDGYLLKTDNREEIEKHNYKKMWLPLISILPISFLAASITQWLTNTAQKH